MVEQNKTIKLMPASKNMPGCPRTVQSQIKDLKYTAFKLSSWFVFVEVPSSDDDYRPLTQMDLF